MLYELTYIDLSNSEKIIYIESDSKGNATSELENKLDICNIINIVEMKVDNISIKKFETEDNIKYGIVVKYKEPVRKIDLKFKILFGSLQ